MICYMFAILNDTFTAKKFIVQELPLNTNP